MKQENTKECGGTRISLLFGRPLSPQGCKVKKEKRVMRMEGYRSRFSHFLKNKTKQKGMNHEN